MGIIVLLGGIVVAVVGNAAEESSAEDLEGSGGGGGGGGGGGTGASLDVSDVTEEVGGGEELVSRSGASLESGGGEPVAVTSDETIIRSSSLRVRLSFTKSDRVFAKKNFQDTGRVKKLG